MEKILLILILTGFFIILTPSVHAQSDRINYFSDEVEPGTTWTRNVGGGCIPSSFAQSVHMWRDVSGFVSWWVTPQKIDWGFVSPGECMETDQWEFTVPENVKPGIYTFEWIEQCSPKSIPECNVLNIEKYEVTVIDSTSTIKQEPFIKTQSSAYVIGDEIVVTGNVGTIISGKQVTIQIDKPNGNGAMSAMESPASDGSFSHTFPTLLDIDNEKHPTLADNYSYYFSQEGTYKVTGEYGSRSLEDSFQMIQLDTYSEPKGGGCLIATATYGSELSPQIQQLRELRDNQLLQTESGISFMKIFNDVYYSFSPYIADYERENPMFREIVKLTITPMITSLSILNNVEMNSEDTVLGYGISLIILNLTMYVGVPASVIVGIRKYL